MKITRAILLFVLLLVLATVSMAQEATAVPTEVVVASAPTAVETVQAGFNLTLIIISVIGLVGTVGLVGALSVLISRLKNDPLAIKNAELLASSFPPDTLERLNQFVSQLGIVTELGNEVAGFLDEVTDGVPADSKPKNPIQSDK